MRRTNIARLDLNLLSVFDAVAKTGSVTAAADRLSLSQPAVSHALKRLRDVTGDPLFVRGRSGLKPTPRAEAMVEAVGAIVEKARGLLAAVGFDPSTTSRAIRLAASDYAVATIVPDLVRALRAAAPASSVEIYPIGEKTLELLESGAIEGAFWGAAPPGPPFEALELFRERFIGLICAGHPLAPKAAVGDLTLDDYLSCPHMLVTFNDPRLSPIDSALEQRGLKRRVAVTTPHFAANVAALPGTDLILSLPSRLAHPAPDRKLVRFDLPLDVASHGYSFVWHRRTDGDAAGRWLRSLCFSLVGDSAPQNCLNPATL